MHLEMPPEMSLREAHLISDEVEAAIRTAFPEAEVLTHQDPAGYEAGASYALYAAAVEHFAPRVAWLDLGAGAGVSAATEGLTQFKRGFATGTRPAFFCGRIGDRDAYEALATQAGSDSGELYFPAYRRADF